MSRFILKQGCDGADHFPADILIRLPSEKSGDFQIRTAVVFSRVGLQRRQSIGGLFVPDEGGNGDVALRPPETAERCDVLPWRRTRRFQIRWRLP